MHASHLAGASVMVIDDSNTIRRSAEIFLKQAGCSVILAENGFDALSRIVEHNPDVRVAIKSAHSSRALRGKRACRQA